MLRKSGGNSAKKPVTMDDKMVLTAASDGGGIDSIVKWRKNLQAQKSRYQQKSPPRDCGTQPDTNGGQQLCADMATMQRNLIPCTPGISPANLKTVHLMNCAPGGCSLVHRLVCTTEY